MKKGIMKKTSNVNSAEAGAYGSDSHTPWYQRVGPGLITACVVIGPGSILTSSKVGAEHGYSMSWIVLVSVAFMLVYMTLGAKLGVAADASPCELITRKAGRWLAVLLGGSVFFISAAFQFGNNLGVDSAFRVILENPPVAGPSSAGFDPLDYTIVLFNALAIAFLFVFKNLYRALERLMMGFVGLMLGSFAINLAFARPNVLEMISGFVPNDRATLDLSMLGLVGTTFVISAAFYQAYLVRQKGWRTEQLRSGLIDTRVGSAIMAALTLMIMSTAAAVLRGNQLGSVADVATQLEPAFGPWGKGLFCLGLFSAAYSSFLVNSMIGGFILSDALGLGSKPSQLWPKLLTSAVLLVGMCVALFNIIADWDTLPAIVAAQAVTVVAAPLIAGTLFWLCNCRDVMGPLRNKPVLNVLAAIGLAMLLALAAYTAIEKIPEKLATFSSSKLPVSRTR